MKFSELGQLALASAVSAALVLGITACGQSNTIDFIYVASANTNPGNIYAYASDGESGALSQIQGSPFPSGGRNPIALLTSPNGKYVYALNHDDNTLVLFAAGSDGKLYSQKTYNPQSGTNPNGMAISADGKTLYVVEAYGLDANNNPYSATTPGIGALVAFPVNSDGTLGTEVSYPTCNNPVAVATTPDGSAVYVVNDPAGQLTTLIDTVATENRNATGNETVTYPAVNGCSGGSSPVGQIKTYTASSGALTQASIISAGVAPVGIAVDPTGRFTYVVDYRSNYVLSYAIQVNAGLVPLTTSTSVTGSQPSAITVEPRGKYIFVSNYGGGTVSGYTINQTTGVPTANSGSSSSSTESGPAAILVEPSTGRYIYTANYIAGTTSGLYFDPNAGTTSQVQNTPFLGAAKATAVTAVKHGDHAVQTNPVY